MESFGAFIRYVRKSKGLTQEQVAEKLNIVSPVLSKWENDKGMPSLDMLCKLCHIYDISIEECIAAQKLDGKPELPPKDFDAERLGENIKSLRLKNNWSQADVGKQLFVTSQTVGKWEAGKLASAETLVELAKLYGVSTAQLLGYSNFYVNVEATQSVAQSVAQPVAQPTVQLVANIDGAASANIPSNRRRIAVISIIVIAIILLGCILGLVLGLNDVPIGGGSNNLPNSSVNPSDEDEAIQKPEKPDESEKPDENGGDGDKEDGNGDDNENGGEDGDGDGDENDDEKMHFVRPTQSLEIAKEFDETIYLNPSLGSYTKHLAVDFVAAEGSDVYAVADGIVVSIGHNELDGYYVKISFYDGRVVCTYMQVRAVDGLEAGDTVKMGQRIGCVDNSINNGVCMNLEHNWFHFEMSIGGEFVDPMEYLSDDVNTSLILGEFDKNDESEGQN